MRTEKESLLYDLIDHFPPELGELRDGQVPCDFLSLSELRRDQTGNLNLGARKPVFRMPLTGEKAEHVPDRPLRGGSQIETVALTFGHGAAIPGVDRHRAVDARDPAVERPKLVGCAVVNEVRDNQNCIQNKSGLAGTRPEEHHRARRQETELRRAPPGVLHAPRIVKRVSKNERVCLF